MTLLSFSGLTKEYNGDYLFTGINGNITDSSKIGLVGSNGVGKTTLLNLLCQNMEKASGDIHHKKNLNIGYLTQNAGTSFAEKSIIDEALGCFSDLIEIENELLTLEKEMSEVDDSSSILEKYGELQNHFERHGGYNFKQETKKVLSGLGLNSIDKLVSECSSGEIMRISIAKLLLQQPDILILDEPTNHLDSDALDWLTYYLINWNKGLIIVSHNRFFLNRVINTVWDLTRVGLEVFKGTYRYYELERVRRWDKREKEFIAQKDMFLSDIDFIRKNSNRNPIKAKERKHKLTRKVKIAVFGKDFPDFWSTTKCEYYIRRFRFVHPHLKLMNMNIKQTKIIPQKIVNSGDLIFGYSGNPLVQADRIEINRKERISLIGGNGSGKSTLLKTLLNYMPCLEGEIEISEHVKVAYYSQENEVFDLNNNVLEEFSIYSKELNDQEIRNHLGGFLFSDSDVYKKIHQLSGGERGRLTLAKLSSREVNFLILDEPTNHLDIYAQEVLEDAMKDFDGAILMVSHDKYLLENISTHIWAIEDNMLMQYECNYTDYLKGIS